jgi:hypothetical protein
VSIFDLWCRLGRHSWEALGLARFGRGKLERCRRCNKARRIVLEPGELEKLLQKDRRFECPSCYHVIEAVTQCPMCGAWRQ